MLSICAATSCGVFHSNTPLHFFGGVIVFETIIANIREITKHAETERNSYPNNLTKKKKTTSQSQFGGRFLLNQTRTAPDLLVQSTNRHLPFCHWGTLFLTYHAIP